MKIKNYFENRNIEQTINESNLKIDKNKIKYNVEMKNYTSFRIGGNAECLIKIETKEELIEILKFSKKHNINLTILGNGSNVLISDNGIKGITILIRINQNIRDIIIKEQSDKENVSDNYTKIIVGAGVKLASLGQFLFKNQLTGFEELSGIPGTIGGAVKMNAGAHGKEMKDVVKCVKCVDYNGNEKILYNDLGNINQKNELEFGYRTSIFKNKKYIITEVELSFQKGNSDDIKIKMEEYKKYRIEKQPIEYPNAGSTFKRCPNVITAKLIDDLGLKGYKVGGAEISTKHAGFIINKKNATAKDVINLVEYIKEKVYEKTGEKLELEIEIIGDY